jgi:subtilisin family serine protease
LRFAPNLYEVRVVGDRDPLEVALALHENADFVYAEPEIIKHIPQRAQPKDPDYGRQWQWNNDGSYGGVEGADVDAEGAWDVTRGMSACVAIIDTGFDVNHPDLAPGIAPHSEFFESSAPGGDTAFIQGLAGYPNCEHGTFCAGIVGARSDNAADGCGIAPRAGASTSLPCTRRLPSRRVPEGSTGDESREDACHGRENRQQDLDIGLVYFSRKGNADGRN